MIKRNMIWEKTWENENPFSDLESQKGGNREDGGEGIIKETVGKKIPQIENKSCQQRNILWLQKSVNDEWKILVNFRAPMIADIHKHFQKGKHKCDLEKSVSRMTQLPTSLEDLSSSVAQ